MLNSLNKIAKKIKASSFGEVFILRIPFRKAVTKFKSICSNYFKETRGSKTP